MVANHSWEFIFLVFVFYSFLFVILFNFGISLNLPNRENIPSLPVNPSIIDYVLIIFKYVGFFFSTIFLSISALPSWLNIIIFTPLSFTMLWVLLSLIRGGS